MKVNFSLRSDVDVYGLTRYCYITDNNIQSPTLRVHPGDELILTLRNDLKPEKKPPTHAMHAQASAGGCGAAAMSATSTNLHFHGMSLPPKCHQDETLRTLIQPGAPPFEYRIKIPENEAPGLYWYHPHPHGFTEMQVLGGASGALIVEGIEHAYPQLAGLPERVLVLRDQPVPGFKEIDEDTGPGKDLSLNFVPVMFPLYKPSAMNVRAGQKEFWRVLNASADTYFDLQVRFGAIIQDVHDVQNIEVVAIDGVPVAAMCKQDHVLLSPGARAEFIVSTPPLGTIAQLVSLPYNSGPDGAANPFRVIANIWSNNDAPVAAARVADPPASASLKFSGLTDVTPALERKLFFSEDRKDLKDPNLQPEYYITLDGGTPKVFDMNFKKPDITVKQGTVEDWVIENRAREAHAFHIHQLHFQLIERDGAKVKEPMLRDTIDLPFWDGKSAHYPSVKLRMDFRSPRISGTFVYHCHILEHEDGGMMGSIRVEP